ncbi:MAG: hypothetical protein AB8B56_16500, partial [Crocinitomicaceae bacterium]
MKKLIAIAVVSMWTLNAYSQQQVGIITNSLGSPIDQVMLKNSRGSNHTHTSSNGHFYLDINKGDTLFLSRQGYAPLDYIHSGQNDTLRITLQENFQNLREVQISGKRSVNEQLANLQLSATPVRNSQEALTLVPGLFVAQHAGGG